jgi:hypothetical protein
MDESNSPKGRARRFGIYAFAASIVVLAPQSVQSRTVSIPFNPANFSMPLLINNPNFPLVVGKTFIYRAATAEGCEENRVTVTNNTKAIRAGVTARVVHDVVYSAPACGRNMLLTEDTMDWYAQDNSGNVWYLGEDSKECDQNGCVQSDGSWEAGADIDHIGSNGVPGLFMLAAPRLGDSYQQEYYAGHAEDVADITGIDIDVMLRRPDAIQPRLFHHCLRTKERSLIEPGSTSNKYYCPNIGFVAEDELSRNGARSELVAIR